MNIRFATMFALPQDVTEKMNGPHFHFLFSAQTPKKYLRRTDIAIVKHPPNEFSPEEIDDFYLVR